MKLFCVKHQCKIDQIFSTTIVATDLTSHSLCDVNYFVQVLQNLKLLLLTNQLF